MYQLMDEEFVYIAKPEYAVCAQQQFSDFLEEEIEFLTLSHNGGLFMRPAKSGYVYPFMTFMSEKFDGAFTPHRPRLV